MYYNQQHQKVPKFKKENKIYLLKKTSKHRDLVTNWILKRSDPSKLKNRLRK